MARHETPAFANLVRPGLRKVTLQSMKDVPKEFRQFANVINEENPNGAGKAYFDDLVVAPLGTYVSKPEGGAIQYDRIQEVGTVRYRPWMFALGARITHEMWEDELYGVMAKIYRILGRSAIHAMEVQGHRPLNGGFTASATATGNNGTGYDALALFSTAHPLKRGGTAANRASTDLDLSQTAVEAASDLLELSVDEAGMPQPRKLSTVVVPVQSRWIAKELFDSELKPYTANNEVNTLEGTSYLVSHYLTDSDSWFASGPKDEHEVNVWIREQPMYDSGDDFDTKDVKLSGMFRMASGFSDWRGWFGSTGAA